MTPDTRLHHPVVPRRTLLQAGGIGLLGLGMQHVSLLRGMAAERPPERKTTAKSVIYIFLSGGLSQHDSFDLKPNAPQEIRGEFQEIPTRTPGLRICEHLPELAKCSHLWSLCRSLSHPFNEHSQGHHVMLTGRSDLPQGFDPGQPKDGDHPSIASIATQLVRSRNNLPPAIVLPEKLVHRTGRTLPGQLGGQMGRTCDPFFLECSAYNPSSYGAYPDYLFHHETGKQDGRSKIFDVPSFKLPEGLDFERLRDRASLLQDLNRQQAYLETVAETQGVSRNQAMAMDLLFDDRTKAAFDVHSAAPKLQDRYGRNAFGWSLLLARQLVESGVSLVQVNLGNNECWDNHQAIFPNLKNFLLPPMDRAVSALLIDLQERGLLESTLVVMAGEFGRTPRISKLSAKALPGRDHWGGVQSVLFAGGGIPGGQVVGSSDKIGAYPASDAQKPENMAATIYEALGLPREISWRDRIDRPNFVYHGAPVPFG
jgi:hypothetical protein